MLKDGRVCDLGADCSCVSRGTDGWHFDPVKQLSLAEPACYQRVLDAPEGEMSKLWYLIDEDFFFGTMRGTRAELDKLLAELPDLHVVSESDYYFANDVLEQKYTLQ